MPRLSLMATSMAALCAAGLMAARANTQAPPAASLPVPPGATRQQVLLGDRVFHGQAASGTCFICHGADAKGTATGNDLTTPRGIWDDGSLKMIRATIDHNMAIDPHADGNLTSADVDAVTAYIWALRRKEN